MLTNANDTSRAWQETKIFMGQQKLQCVGNFIAEPVLHVCGIFKSWDARMARGQHIISRVTGITSDCEISGVIRLDGTG